MLITSKEIDIAFRRGYEARVAEEKQERDANIRDAITDADPDPRFTTPPTDTDGKLSGEVAGLIEYSETQAMLEGGDRQEQTMNDETRMRVDGINAAWINNNQPADVVVMTCTKCGWELEIRAGDPPIPHGDPRLTCPHAA